MNAFTKAAALPEQDGFIRPEGIITSGDPDIPFITGGPIGAPTRYRPIV